MSIPIVLVFAGGGVGAAFGLLGIYSSAQIFRSDQSTAGKFGLSGLISLGVALAFLACVALFEILLGQLREG